jgi:hypothetical protein
MKKINREYDILPQITGVDPKNIGLPEIIDIHSKLNIIYYPKNMSNYYINEIYPKLRTDNKLQLHLYTDTVIQLYKYNENVNFLFLKKKEWSYFLGYCINNKNELAEVPSIRILN